MCVLYSVRNGWGDSMNQWAHWELPQTRGEEDRGGNSWERENREFEIEGDYHNWLDAWDCCCSTVHGSMHLDFD